jgi:peptide/nickel transport system permease protein
MMSTYLLKRLAAAIPVLFLITLVVFIVVYFIPGDPAMVILGHDANAQALAAVRHSLGLDRPLHERYLIWLSHVLRGDLGLSILSRKPVLLMIAQALPVTLHLVLLSMLLAVLISVPCGTIAALKHNTWVDLLVSSWSLFGLSVPGFWLGMVLIYIFSAQLKWVPLQGYISPFSDFWGSLRSMALPVVTLGVFLSGPQTRYLRASMLDVLAQEHVVVARAKGLRARSVIARHVLRNALIPFVTVLGIQFGYLLGGAVVIEEIFALPGLGRLAVNGIESRDYPVVQGIVLVVATGFVLVNILVDALYSVLDPRIRLGGGSSH